jgi:predicted dehydrogenase
MAKELKVAMIGLDTSHTIEFSRLIQGDAPAETKIDGLRVTGCMRFPTKFQNEEGQDKRQALLESWGVPVTRSFDEAVRGADAIMVEINEPALHLQYFEQAAGLGKPIYLDKPLAGNLAEGKRIVDLANRKKIKLWSSSSLRFAPALVEARKAVPHAAVCTVHGYLGEAPAGSDLIWYGVHTVEMLVTAMGRGARSVRGHRDTTGVVLAVSYPEDRRGIVEANRFGYQYGGCLQLKDDCCHFKVEAGALYATLLKHIRDCFLGGPAPVPLDETLEIQAIMDAGERSLSSGKEESISL